MDRRHALGSVVCIAMFGCGLNMEKNYAHVRPKLLAHNYDDASAYLDSVKESFYSKNNRLLYYMDKGMVLHLAKRYEDSNTALEQAKTAAAELWTESVGANAAAWVTTDNSVPYQGEDFEKVLIHFVAALNHIGLGSLSDARVEARQITNDLELYNSKYEDANNTYRDDAFSRWLAGRLAETDEDQGVNDAWIDYRKALEIYERDYSVRYNTALPRVVINDALRALHRLGPDFADERAALQAKYPQASADLADPKEQGQLIFMHLSGEAPYKVDRYWTAFAGPEVLRIAYPEFVPKQHRITGARVRVRQNNAVAHTEKMEDITAIAVQNLEDHMGRIRAKAIARAVAKFVAGSSAVVAGSRVGGNAGAAMQIAGTLWNAGNAAAEEADKRSWITLPAAVNVAELSAPKGPINVDVEFFGAAGEVLEHAEFDAVVAPGQTTFLTYRTYL